MTQKTMAAALLAASASLLPHVGCVETTCEDDPLLCDTRVASEIRNQNLAQAIDIVFVSEGYLEEDLPRFHEDVEALKASMAETTAALTAREPTMFNFHAVSAPSKTRLVEDGNRDNTLLGADLRLDEYKPSGWKHIDGDEGFLLKMASLAPDVDVAVAVVRGASGRPNATRGSVGTVRLSSQDAKPSDGTFVHELGHALFGLGDEYTEVGQCAVPRVYVHEAELLEVANLSTEESGEAWWHHFGAGWSGPVEGGARFERCLYHPTPRCKMNDSDDEFCPVCAAEIEAAILTRKCGHERLPPRIAIVAPEPQTRLWRTLWFEAAAFDHSGMARMTVTLDPEVLYEGPWRSELKLDIHGPDGVRRLCVRGEDPFGQGSERCVLVEVIQDPLTAPITDKAPGDWPPFELEVNGWNNVSEIRSLDALLSVRRLRPLSREYTLLGFVVDSELLPFEDPSSARSIFRSNRGERRTHDIAAIIEDSEGRRARVSRQVLVVPPEPPVLRLGDALLEGAQVSGTIPIHLVLEGERMAPPQAARIYVRGRGEQTLVLPRGTAPDSVHRLTAFLDTDRFTSGPLFVFAEVTDGWGWRHELSLRLEVDHEMGKSTGASPRLIHPTPFEPGTEVVASIPSGQRVHSVTLWFESGPLATLRQYPYTWAFPTGVASPADVLAAGGVHRALVLMDLGEGRLVGSKVASLEIPSPDRDSGDRPRPVCELREVPLGCQSAPSGRHRSGGWLWLLALVGALMRRAAAPRRPGSSGPLPPTSRAGG